MKVIIDTQRLVFTMLGCLFLGMAIGFDGWLSFGSGVIALILSIYSNRRPQIEKI